jgi:hypothetical protein
VNDPPQSLDWRDRGHWSNRVKPCRYCGDLTHLRDDERKPSHKVCAEQTLTEKEPA